MSSVVISGDVSGSVTLQAPSASGSTVLTLPATSGTLVTTASTTGISGSAISSGTVAEAYGGTGTTTGYYSFKNRIINGQMQIDQRNAGASVSATNGSYTIDRWVTTSYDAGAQTGKFTVQQNSGTAPTTAGFSQCVKITSSAATTVSSNGIYAFNQPIEGLNVSDLAWGTASAKSVTVSFWVYSSLTGNFGGAINNDAGNYNYPFQYTITTANTWTYCSVSISGPTSGTWLTTNGVGAYLRFGLGAGSAWTQPAGAWTASTAYSANSSVSVVSTNAATWYITGVQLEKGSTATSFDYRDYGRELSLCQRYYYRIKADAGGQVLGSGMMNSATTGRFFIPFMVPMRTSPTALEQSGTATNYVVFNGGSAQNCDAVPTFNSATLYGAGLQATIASGGTIGYGALIRADSSAAYLGWSAEL